MMQTKRKQMLLQLYDHTGFERKLEQLARKGWKLEACGTFFGWKFRKIEPTELKYKVVYFPDASEFDPAPGDRQAEFVELCEQSGWEYVDHAAQMLIFCTERKNAMPIETDAMMQVEVAHKAMKKNWLPGQIALLVLAVMQLLLLGYRLNTELMNVLSYDGLLVSFAAYTIMAVLCIYHLSSYYFWRKKALEAAADGVFVETRGNNLLEKCMLLMLLVIFAAWMASISDDGYLLRVAVATFAAIIGVIGLVNGAKLLMQKWGFETETNRIVTYFLIFVGTIGAIILMTGFLIRHSYTYEVEPKSYVGTYEFAGRTHYVYDDPIPLTLEMLGIEADYEYRSRCEDVTDSMLITIYNGQEIAPWGTPAVNPPELYYTVTIPRFKGMVDACAEDILDDKRIRNLYGIPEAGDARPWEAEAAYAHMEETAETGYYTLVYADRIVEIGFPEVPTDEQIKIAVDALKNYEPK